MHSVRRENFSVSIVCENVNQSSVSGEEAAFLSHFLLFCWQTAATVTYFSNTAAHELHAIISALSLFDGLPRCLSRDTETDIIGEGGRRKNSRKGGRIKLASLLPVLHYNYKVAACLTEFI